MSIVLWVWLGAVVLVAVAIGVLQARQDARTPEPADECRDCEVVGHWESPDHHWLNGICPDCMLARKIAAIERAQRARERQAEIRQANQKWMDAQ